MSSFNCIPNGCARVVWQPYQKKSGIRYRLKPQDNWIYLDADDYTITTSSTCVDELAVKLTYTMVAYEYNTPHEIIGQQEVTASYEFYAYEGQEVVSDLTINPRGTLDVPNVGNVAFDFDIFYEAADGSTQTFRCDLYHGDFIPDDYQGSNSDHRIRGLTDTIQIVEFGQPTCYDEYYDEELDFYEDEFCIEPCRTCSLYLFKDGVQIASFEQIQGNCPEVETVDELDDNPCQLSDTFEEIEIDKTPFLSAIDVLEFGHGGDRIRGIPFPIATPVAIPEHCLNIYRFEIFDPLPDDDDTNSEDPTFGDFITQICSSEGCPRPEFEVFCDCDRRSCPINTCSEVCSTVVCCYNPNTGQVVEEIPISEYFPDNTTGA